MQMYFLDRHMPSHVLYVLAAFGFLRLNGSAMKDPWTWLILLVSAALWISTFWRADSVYKNEQIGLFRSGFNSMGLPVLMALIAPSFLAAVIIAVALIVAEDTWLRIAEQKESSVKVSVDYSYSKYFLDMLCFLYDILIRFPRTCCSLCCGRWS